MLKYIEKVQMMKKNIERVLNMIHYVKGDLFESPAKVIVNPVNTVGAMGRGIALEFKTRYPDMYTTYRRYCQNKEFSMGNLMIWKSSDKWILLFPTKKHWRKPSDIKYIEIGLKKFINIYQDKCIDSIAFPKLGCGNGGLEWEEEVKPIMEKYLSKLPITVLIYI